MLNKIAPQKKSRKSRYFSGKFLILVFLIYFSNAYPATVDIGIYGTDIGNGTMDIRIRLTAVGGNYTANGASGLIFTIKYPAYPTVIWGTDSLYNSVTQYDNFTGNSGDLYRAYQSTTLTMSLASGASVQVLRVNVNALGSILELVSVDGDGLTNIQYYIDNYLGTEVTGIVSPKTIQTPLPVELIGFTHSVSDNNVKLNWSTSKEENNKGFYIEKSIRTSTLVWSEIAFVEGKKQSGENNHYSYTDKKLQTGKYAYRLKQVDYNGNSQYYYLNSDVIISAPTKFDLSQNYPNPFNPMTNIDFQIPFDSKDTLLIYDISGREVLKLINDNYPAGYYTKQFDAKNISSGTYFYRLIASGNEGQHVLTKKMMVIK